MITPAKQSSLDDWWGLSDGEVEKLMLISARWWDGGMTWPDRPAWEIEG